MTPTGAAWPRAWLLTATFLTVLLAVIAILGARAVGETQDPQMSDHETLLALNRDYIRAVQDGDVDRFREILAEDFRVTNPDGSFLDKAGFLEQTARPVTISELAAHDVEVRIMGDFAIVHARTSYVGPDGRTRSGRYTDVWARRDGRWVAVAAHVTRGS